jgi:membrane-bound inhibitor of C-type lysozyme
LKRVALASTVVFVVLAAACGRVIEEQTAATPEASTTPEPPVALRSLPQPRVEPPPLPTAPPFESFDHASQPSLTKFVCDGGKTFEAWVFPPPGERAVVVINGQTHELRQRATATGIEYASTSMTFRADGPRGPAASLREGDQTTYTGCRAQ